MVDLLKLFEQLKYDKHKLTLICGITAFIFYILEKIEFRKIILLVIIFSGVFLYLSKEKINKLIDDKSEKIKKNLRPFNNVKGEKKIDIPKKIINFKLKNPDFSDKVFKINELDSLLKKLEDFIKVNYKEIIFSYGETNKRNINLDLFHNIKKKLRNYLNQVELILINEYYLDKSFEKLIAIKKEIIYLIHSIYFKINSIYDKKVNHFIKELNVIFDSIENELKLRINKDYFKDTNCFKGMINMEKNSPEKYDPHESLNDITLLNNNVTL